MLLGGERERERERESSWTQNNNADGTTRIEWLLPSTSLSAYLMCTAVSDAITKCFSYCYSIYHNVVSGEILSLEIFSIKNAVHYLTLRIRNRILFFKNKIVLVVAADSSVTTATSDYLFFTMLQIIWVHVKFFFSFFFYISACVWKAIFSFIQSHQKVLRLNFFILKF